jgi:hypothetical protein
MRQQFLAYQMEKARELEAERVSLLHISPAHNRDFCKVTSPSLEELGTTATGVWGRLVKQKDRFLAVHTEDLFRRFPIEQHPDLQTWWNYISERYRWIHEPV